MSLQVEQGDIFGFLGPNGAGKSTTIRSLLGLIKFNQGSASILGMDVKNRQSEILREIGYMPSEAMFYPSMRVKDVIRFAADMRRTDCKEEAEMLCERLEVDCNKKIEELSLGNRKKVSIVCAMQHRPKLFIFDEPTSGLDPLMQSEFFNLVMEYNRQGVTCFLSSHVLSEIKKYCRHAAIIKEGRLICTDIVENLTRTNQLFMQIEIATVCFMLSAFAKKNLTGAGFGIVILMFALDMMCRIIPAIENFKYITPFYYSNAADIFTRGQIDGVMTGIGVGIAIVSFGLAWIWYGRKDLAV